MTCQYNIKLNSDLQLALSSQRNVVSVEGHSHSRDHLIGHNSGHLHLVIFADAFIQSDLQLGNT